MFRSDKQIYEDANSSLNIMNAKFIDKKVVGILVINDFFLKNDTKAIKIRHQKNMTFYPLDISFTNIALSSAKHQGLYTEFYLQWKNIFNALLPDTSNQGKKELFSTICQNFEGYQLVHSVEEIELYCTVLYQPNIGHVIVLYDNLDNYFENTNITITFEKDGEEQSAKQVITKQEGLNMLLELTNDESQIIEVGIEEDDNYISILKKLDQENNVVKCQEIQKILGNTNTNNQILQLLLLNK